MRGQISSTDFVIGFLIFILAIFTFFSYSTIQREQNRMIDLTSLTEALLTEGYPAEWNASTVLRIGLLTDGAIDPEKWNEMHAMMTSEDLSAILGAPYTFWMSIEPSDLEIITNHHNTTLPDFDDIATVRRFERIVAYNATIARLEVIGWQ